MQQLPGVYVMNIMYTHAFTYMHTYEVLSQVQVLNSNKSLCAYTKCNIILKKILNKEIVTVVHLQK